jgi:hypothetical protein
MHLRRPRIKASAALESGLDRLDSVSVRVDDFVKDR